MISHNLWQRAELTAAGLLLFCSIVINVLGATENRIWSWNVRPINIDEKPERIWDWKNPQFLAK